MFSPKLYVVKGLLPTEKTDEHGLSILDWRIIYCQVNNGTLEYTTNKHEARQGDFVPDWYVISKDQADGTIVKLQQKVKGKNTKSKFLKIQHDERYPNDLSELWNALDEFSKSSVDIGRPLNYDVHVARGVSALSRNSEHTEYRGLVNILLILLVLSNIRFVISKGQAEGWAVGRLLFNTITGTKNLDMIQLTNFGIAMHWMATIPIISYIIERFIAIIEGMPRRLIFFFITLNMIYCLFYPIYHVKAYNMNPLAAWFYLMFACIWFFKFVSYHHIWHDIRYHKRKLQKIEAETKNSESQKLLKKNEKQSDEKTEKVDPSLGLGNKIEDVLAYPRNIRIFDIWMYLFIPTVCFQLRYPYNDNVPLYKKIFNFWYRITECLVWTVIWVTIVAEFSLPIVEQCVSAIKSEDYYTATYKFMQLSIPNTYGWFFQFYLGFHAYLNAWAELTGFSDKNFYDDWWNSKTIGEYWRKWNLPIHNWLTRHLYFPMRRRKFSRGLSMAAVFTFSALLHEYMLAGCFGVVTFIGFNGMMTQLPFIILQERYKKFLGGQIGNIFFWIFFCVIGQPSGMVSLYYVMS